MSAELAQEAQSRLQRWASCDEDGVLAADLPQLVDELVRAATQRLSDADDLPAKPIDVPLSWLSAAAQLLQCRAQSLAHRPDAASERRSLIKHAGFIGLTVALRAPGQVPENLHLAVALAAGSWSADLLAQVQAGRMSSRSLDEVIAAGRLAIAWGRPLSHRPGPARALAVALAIWFEESGRRAEIDEAVALLRELAEAAEDQGQHVAPSLPSPLIELGLTLKTRYEYLGDAADLAEAIDLLSRVRSDTGVPQAASLASSLAEALLARYERSGQEADLTSAVETARQAVDLSAHSDPAVAERLSALGTALRAQFDLTGDPALLDQAVAAHRSAVRSGSGRPSAPGQLMNLGNALRARFEVTGLMPDLEAAIAATREGLLGLPDEHPGQARFRSNLGAMLRLWHDTQGGAAELDESIDLQEEALQRAGDDDPYRPRYSANLSGALISRYDLRGDVADLHRAVEVARVAEAGSSGPADRARALTGLAGALMSRYERRGAASDLDQTISAMRTAVGLLPEGHVEWPRYASNLGMALQTRFQRTESEQDLDEAVAVARAAVQITPVAAPARAARMSNLAGALEMRFRATGDLVALLEAVDLLGRVLKRTSQADVQYGVRASNLGLAFLLRSQATGDPQDIGRAIDLARISAQRSAGPGRARSLINLASAEVALGRRTGSDESFGRAASAWEEAALLPAAAGPDRVIAAAAWAASEAERHNWAVATKAYGIAVEHLVSATWEGVLRSDNEYLIEGWRGLATDAAAAALAAHQLGAAVAMLDAGRGILWAQHMDLHTDTRPVAAVAPDLARALERLRQRRAVDLGTR